MLPYADVGRLCPTFVGHDVSADDELWDISIFSEGEERRKKKD
jgi:hypothetical protein